MKLGAKSNPLIEIFPEQNLERTPLSMFGEPNVDSLVVDMPKVHQRQLMSNNNQLTLRLYKPNPTLKPVAHPALQDHLDSQANLVSPEDPVNLDSLDLLELLNKDMHNLPLVQSAQMDLQVHLDKVEHLDSPDRMVNLEHLVLVVDLACQDHLVHPEMMVSLVRRTR